MVQVKLESKPNGTSENGGTNGVDNEVRERKAGQKFPTPTTGYGDRVFYETLLRQRPDSLMAQEWCVHYGVLPEEEANRYYKQMLKRKQKGGSTSSSKSTPKKKPRKNASKKAVYKEERFDTGMGTGGDEGIGLAAL